MFIALGGSIGYWQGINHLTALLAAAAAAVAAAAGLKPTYLTCPPHVRNPTQLYATHSKVMLLLLLPQDC
jgi:hypothetical protein